MLRKRHNRCKLHLLQKYCPTNSTLLDVGSGRGGDLHKWNTLRLKVVAVEPNMKLLQEATMRYTEMGKKRPRVQWMHGDSRTCTGEFDAVSYMFSLHWILEDQPRIQFQSAIARLKPGGVMFGTVPDGDRIREKVTSSCTEGEFQMVGDDRVQWRVQGPFYDDGWIEEPLLTKAHLEDMCHENGCALEEWEEIGDESTLSYFYRKFAIRKRIPS